MMWTRKKRRNPAAGGRAWRRQVDRVPGLLLVCLLAACHSSQPRNPLHQKAPAAAPPGRVPDLQFAGKVIRVNADMGYILVECAVLPNTDEEARVLRGEVEVGRVRFTGPFAFPYATADVVEGRPMVGDRVRK